MRGQRRAGAFDELDERAEHLRRQVVDDVPAEVFEGVADGGAAGAGHPGDDEHLLLLGLGCHRLVPPSARRHPSLPGRRHAVSAKVRADGGREGRADALDLGDVGLARAA